MILSLLLLTPLIGALTTLASPHSDNKKFIKTVGLTTSVINMMISLVIFIMFDFSTNQYQFVQESHQLNSFSLYLGADGLSIYFILLTTIITPIALLSN